MAAFVTHLFRHPIKSVGHEPLTHTDLEAGKAMPFDRLWAITNDRSKFDPDNPEWMSCANFIRGSKAPSLIAFSARLEGSIYTVIHAGTKESFSFNPDDPAQHAGFLAFVAGYIPENRAMPKALVKLPARGMTDTDFPSISILSQSSLKALAGAAGQPLKMERFRGNIWLEGLAPWAERQWLGKRLRIGGTEILLREHIGRCAATTANPATGAQDVDTLEILRQNWGHSELGIYGEVIKSGRITLDDKVEIL